MGVTATVVAAASAVGSVYSQNQAGKAQKKAGKEQRAIARAETLQQRKQQIRQARIARGAAINQGYTTGGIGSTVSGATGSIQSQLGTNVAFGESTFQRSDRAAGFTQQASDHMTTAGIFNTIGNTASPFATFPGSKKQ